MKMSYSKLVDYVKLSPHCKKPRKSKIDTIVIHHMAGNLTVETCAEVFSGNRRASSNYGVGSDGRIGCYVEEENRALTTSSNIDERAITIEVSNCGGSPNWPVSDKALEATIELCADVCRRHGFKLNYTGDKSGNLQMHRWYAPTLCPGPYLMSKFEYIAKEVNKRLGVKDDVTPKPIKESYTQKQFVMDVQRATGAAVDGIAGPETLSKTVTVSAKINIRHAVVKPLQKRLYELGYTEVGTADGIAGPKFTSAVAHYQQDNGCYVDGEITARNKTWKKLLGLA